MMNNSQIHVNYSLSVAEKPIADQKNGVSQCNFRCITSKIMKDVVFVL